MLAVKKTQQTSEILTGRLAAFYWRHCRHTAFLSLQVTVMRQDAFAELGDFLVNKEQSLALLAFASFFLGVATGSTPSLLLSVLAAGAARVVKFYLNKRPPQRSAWAF